MSQCTATSKRSKARCRRWALKGKSTCHMHGGRSTGPKSMAGKERAKQAVLKHGRYTKELLDQHREVIALIRETKNLIQTIQ